MLHGMETDQDEHEGSQLNEGGSHGKSHNGDAGLGVVGAEDIAGEVGLRPVVIGARLWGRMSKSEVGPIQKYKINSFDVNLTNFSSN